MKQLIIFITLIMLLTVAKTKSAEIIPVWDKIWKQGSPQFTNRIHDFEFLRGEDQFIMIAGVEELGAVEIRKTLTGELVTSFPLPNASYFNQIEITPDSNRFVITTGGDKVNSPAIELRSIEDFNLISRLPIQMDDDSVDNVGQPYYFVFKDIVIDPVKPYIYAFITKTNYYDDDDLDRTWLKVYNYETMEEVRDLTPNGFEYELMKCMDVSDDGSQLAVLNEGKAYLKVWDTETFELTINKQLYDIELSNPNDYWCKSDDIEFSSINSDLIFFSGKYPQKNVSLSPNGLFTFNIIEGLIDNVPPLDNYTSGKFILFDVDKKTLIYNGNRLFFLNMFSGELILNIFTELEYPFGTQTLYSKRNNIFVGFSDSYYGGAKFDNHTNIESDMDEETVIFPNPSNGQINFTLNNQIASNFNYEIISNLGQIILAWDLGFLKVSSNQLRIDISTIPHGHYILRINSENEEFIFNIIKEG